MEIIYRALLWTLFFCHHTRSEDEKCDSALGMKSKAVPDESITSSSHLDSNHKAKHGRGRFERENKKAWCSAKEDTEPYIQIKFVEEKAITAVKTQGSSTDFIYSKKIKVMYLDGGAWTPYKEELTGNSNVHSIKMNTFHPAIRTKSIRIYPKEPFAMFNPGGKVVCLRLELYGCSAPAGCSDPGSPTNGERIGVNFDHGSQVSFSCRQGFVQVGNSTSVCYRGSWSNAPPQCKATCKDPGIPKNGYRKGSNFIDGDSVEFHCNQNYSLFGAPIVRCLEGRWSATLPECKASCADPGIPLNGDRVGSDFGHGKHLQFICKSGFWLVGSQLIVCSEGKWSNDIPKCKAVCSDPGIPSNGNRIGDDFGDGQIVAYMCNENFTLVGARTVFCVAGQWNATKPTCKASCSDPGIPQRGRRIGSHFGHGIQVTFVCLPKYSLLGSQSMTCHDGKWSSIIPVCKAYCKDPGSPQNGVRHGNEFTHNKRISFTCLPGYELTGSASAVCINGKWSASVPRCKAICPDPGIPLNGSRIGNSFLDGQTVAFRCQQSYTLIGSHILRCVAGKWNNKLPECKAPCLNPAVPPNGRILNARLVNLHGARVRFACKTGFQMEGPINVKCVDGKWTSAGPSCEDIDECASGTSNCHANAVCKNTPGSYTCTCKTNSVGDGRTCLKLCANPGVLSHGERKGNKFQHGKRVTFTCEVGYRLVGSSSLTCLEGEWSSALPHCQKNCADPGFPPNGFTRGSNFQHGEKVTFVCQPGFKLAGVTSTTCNNGAWSDTVPVCRAPCDQATNPTNGWKWGDSRHGSSVQFACSRGYQRVGVVSITCNDGTWDNQAPVCKGVCGRPRTPLKGRLHGNSFLDGDEVTFSCERNYDLFGKAKLLCAGRSWNSPIPDCKARCRFMGRPEHGLYLKGARRAGDMIKHGERISYRCFNGYTLIGANMQECNNGRWTNDRPACKASCRSPGGIDNGRKMGQDYSHGKTVRYECDSGYTVEGENSLTCNDGTWNFDPPKCGAPCNDPGSPFHGGKRGDSFIHNSWVQFFCDQNYQLEGDRQIRCDDGSWTGSLPDCVTFCPDPGVPVHGRRLGDDFRDGEKVTFECDNNYDLFGNNTVQCNGGAWSGGRPECKGRCTFGGSPENGYTVRQTLFTGAHLKHGHDVQFACKAAYTLVGSSALHCDNGNWNGSVPVCKASCEDPGFIEHGKRTGSDFSHGQLVTYKCKQGYSLEGNHQLKCENGEWDSERPQCKASCPQFPPLRNGKVKNNHTKHGAFVYFSCDEAFNLKGSKRLECIDGNWTGSSPTCKASCKDPGQIKNGMISGDYSYGSSITFRCDGGYQLRGPLVLTCEEGKWNGSIPECIKSCKDPGVPQNGHRIGSNFDHGAVVKFHCKNGTYDLLGAKDIKCNNGEWNNLPPTCKAKCSDPGEPDNGVKDGTDYRSGSNVTFSCNPPFDLIGSQMIICKDGQWSDSTPTCTSCGRPLGMENYDISDAKIRSPHWISEPKFARLNGDSAWCTTRQSYLQIDLTKTYKLTAIATQGGTGLNRWVKRYKVGFNVGSIPVIYSETGSQKVIDGNKDASSIVKYWFRKPFVTKVVRLYPDVGASTVCLRMELYGCADPRPDCILVGSSFWGLWTYRQNSYNYYQAFITKLNATHLDFALKFNNRLTSSYKRTDPVLVIDKIPEMKDITVNSQVIAVHKPDMPEWYRVGKVTGTSRSSVYVTFHDGQRRWVRLQELHLVRRPRFCDDGV